MRPLILFISIVFLAACSKSSSSNNKTPDELLNDVQGPAVQVDSMPLAVGNTWIYNVNDQYDDTIKVVADTIINGQVAAAVSTFDKGRMTTNYYANRSGGYYLVARGYTSPDSLAILSPAVLMLSFPISLGQAWSAADSFLTGNAQSMPYLFFWKWDKYVNLTTPAGAFNCCRSLRTGAYPISTYHYYTAKGLIKEVQITGYATTPGTGPQYEVSNTISLLSVNF